MDKNIDYKFRFLIISKLPYVVGARVSAKNRGDDTPLHNAAQTGKLDVAKVRVFVFSEKMMKNISNQYRCQ